MQSSKPAALYRTLRFCSSAAKLNYPHSIMIPTRWNDNDSFGHVNNAVYYEFMDTAVNNHLIQNGCTGARFLVSSSCNYIRSLQYPQPVEVGLRIAKLGRSSATYAIGIFGHPTTMSIGGMQMSCTSRELCAEGTFVHVYVDEHGRPTPIADRTRRVLQSLCVEDVGADL